MTTSVFVNLGRVQEEFERQSTQLPGPAARIAQQALAALHLETLRSLRVDLELGSESTRCRAHLAMTRGRMGLSALLSAKPSAMQLLDALHAGDAAVQFHLAQRLDGLALVRGLESAPAPGGELSPSTQGFAMMMSFVQGALGVHLRDDVLQQSTGEALWLRVAPDPDVDDDDEGSPLPAWLSGTVLGLGLQPEHDLIAKLRPSLKERGLFAGVLREETKSHGLLWRVRIGRRPIAIGWGPGYCAAAVGSGVAFLERCLESGSAVAPAPQPADVVGVFDGRPKDLLRGVAVRGGALDSWLQTGGAQRWEGVFRATAEGLRLDLGIR
jgi:hypothetical protein